MKRFASLTALLLTLVLVLSLAACGDKNTADDNQTTDQPSTTQPADNGDAAQTNGTTTGSVDLAALRDQLIADCGYTDTLPVETAGLESTYGHHRRPGDLFRQLQRHRRHRLPRRDRHGRGHRRRCRPGRGVQADQPSVCHR